MARMIPDSFDYSETRSGGEERVYNSLRDNLNDNWTVCHSWRWIQYFTNTKQKKYQGEGDFVLYNQNYGIIVIEVKGGTIEFRDNGKYYSNGNEIKNPEKQASDTKFTIVDRLREKNLNRSCYVIHCVWFPDIKWQIEYPPNLNERILFDSNALVDPEGYLIRAYQGNNASIISTHQSNEIERILHRSFTLVKCLRFRIEDLVEEQVRLTYKQAEAFEYLNTETCLGIRGRAGTGKTLLAVNRARLLEKKGLKVLFLCYNRALADFLANELSDTNIYVNTYHGYAQYYLNTYYSIRLFIQPGDDGYFEYIGNELAELITENMDEFDACVIDEAQDLKMEWFLELKETFFPLKVFYYFFDPFQLLFSRKIKNDESYFNFGSIVIPLEKNMRNTKEVSQSSMNIIQENYNPEENFSSLRGDHPEIVLYENSGIEKLEEICKQLLIVEFMSTADITILSMEGKNKSKFGQEAHGIEIIPFRKFKGLENKIIIVVDVNYSHFEDAVYQRELYMAITRSNYSVYILVDNSESLMKKTFCKRLSKNNIDVETIKSYLMEENYE
ncbi:MAG: NERD domain-containing protein [Ignavibacteriales bacterium]|nr:NERD domain-containing protein [Ignavibacteriales bacterium]